MRNRVSALQSTLHHANLAAAVCCRPENLLACTGFWPVVGNSLAVVSVEGGRALIVPEDEKELAGSAAADEILIYEAASLDALEPVNHLITDALREALRRLGCVNASCGHDAGPSVVPATYVATYQFGAGLPHILEHGLSATGLQDISTHFARLRAVLTDDELSVVRTACDAARSGFRKTAEQIAAGVTERDVARTLSSAVGAAFNRIRAGAFGFCMSGPNSAKAYRAYQLPGTRALEENDVVLLHVNSTVDGFWTDISRTYRIGHPSPQAKGVQAAVLEATRAALDAIRPGVSAAAVDHAARYVLEKAGWGKEFRHATGHGVGFAAIDHNAFPRIHPKSPDTLETGMVFNVEPAAYFPDEFGVRQCNMVAVTTTGCELLTPFDGTLDELVIGRA
ncbi:MAG TPA: Xaa-Pro peptidase family protein [Bryobacteraceae bacterium]|nr:Xaa-Pro peptidase family protein [Bryobacteraceae bacterium]